MNEIPNEIETNEAEVLTEEISESISIDAPEVPDDREMLLAKIAELESLLAKERFEHEKRRTELAELARIFPEADPNALPDEVVAQNERGVPLAAAYALYEKLHREELAAAAAANAKNAERLNPSVFGSAAEPYFSAEEVKRMSSSQVKENFSHIKRSMKHWAKK